MSLLWMDYDEEFKDLVDVTFGCEENGRSEYFAKLSKHTKKIIRRDTKYNIDYLYTAYKLDEEKIITDYAIWLYKLLASIFKERTLLETANYIIDHFNYIREAVKIEVDKDKQQKLFDLIDAAKDCIKKEAESINIELPKPLEYEKEINQYMVCLLSKNAKKTMYLVQEFIERKIPINDIYVNILAECMRKVGELWHTAQITVDTEHYCTSITQMAMAQMYPILFEKERKDKTIICACPGTELHEIGARMVADIFENDGWNSIYLGAAVPIDAAIESVKTNKPNLLALSVTMPQHLITCYDLILAIKKKFPNLKIAVGGKAFESTNHIWEKWPIDIYTKDANQLLEMVNSRGDI